MAAEGTETDIQWIKKSLERIETIIERNDDSRDTRCNLNEDKIGRLQRFQWQIVGGLITVQIMITITIHLWRF